MIRLLLLLSLFTSLHAAPEKKKRSSQKSETERLNRFFKDPASTEPHSFKFSFSWGDDKKESFEIYFDDKKYYPEKKKPPTKFPFWKEKK